MPTVSIILPFHNNADTLTATLNGLLNQSFQDWEAICVDDHSCDASADIVGNLAARDPRIKMVQNTGKGPSDARNLAVDLALADIVAFCDADDIWLPTKLLDLVEAFRSTTIDAVYGRIRFFASTPGDCPTESAILKEPLTIAHLLSENPVCTLSNLSVRRSAFRNAGAFDPTLVHNEDLDLLIRLVGLGHLVVGVDEVHVWYRTSTTGLSSDLDAMRKGRDLAIETAAKFGVLPTPASEAVYMRYLARRALRLDAPRGEAWAYARKGLAHSATAFLFPVKRGAATAIGSLAALLLPKTFRRALFAR